MARPRICSQPGCPTIHDGPGSRCPAHEQAAAQRHRARGQGYRTRGHVKRFRPAVLERDPICVACGLRESTVADHHPRSRAHLVALGLDPNNPDYGRGLCKPCHDRETARNQPGGWNVR